MLWKLSHYYYARLDLNIHRMEIMSDVMKSTRQDTESRSFVLLLRGNADRIKKRVFCASCEIKLA